LIFLKGQKFEKAQKCLFGTKNSVFLQKVVKMVFNYYYSKSVNFKSKISLSVPAKLNILPRIILFITQIDNKLGPVAWRQCSGSEAGPVTGIKYF
jgi:hypothetical protein